MSKELADAVIVPSQAEDVISADDIIIAKRMMIDIGIDERDFISMFHDFVDAHKRLKSTVNPVELTVWEGPMPESNGKSNFTAMLMRKGGMIEGGITISRSEYPDRVRYEADCLRHLIGELDAEPCILDYDADKHSGYQPPIAAAPAKTSRRELVGHPRIRKWDGTDISVDSLISLLREYTTSMPVNGIAQWAMGAAANYIAGRKSTSLSKGIPTPLSKYDAEGMSDLVAALRRDASGGHSATVFQLDQAAALIESAYSNSHSACPESRIFHAESPGKALDDAVLKFLTDCTSTSGSMISGDHLARQAKKLLDAALIRA